MLSRPFKICHNRFFSSSSCSGITLFRPRNLTGFSAYRSSKNMLTSSSSHLEESLKNSSTIDTTIQSGLGEMTSTHRNQMHRNDLDEYFNTQTFDFGSRDHNAALEVLKRSMELVFLRDRPLICIDIEAYERQPSKVTEIGVAIYDPRGTRGHTIVPEIRTAHILLDTNLKLRNGRFVPDRKSLHMGGTSHIMTKKEISRFFEITFQKYLTQGGCIVGHQVGGDLKWLDMIGVQVPGPVRIIDTLALHKLTRLNNGLLRALLRSLNIPHGYLHNAANDAYYTMLVALALCDPRVRQRYDLDAYKVSDSPKDSTQSKRQEKFSDLAKFIESDAETMFAALETP